MVVEVSFRDFDKQGTTLETLISKYDWKEFNEADGKTGFTLSAYGFPEPKLDMAAPAPARLKANDQSGKTPADGPAKEVPPANDQAAVKETSNTEFEFCCWRVNSINNSKLFLMQARAAPGQRGKPESVNRTLGGALRERKAAWA